MLLFSFLIEVLQYLHFTRWLGLENSRVAKVLLGDSFAWADMLAYIGGVVVVLLAELSLSKRSGRLRNKFLPY